MLDQPDDVRRFWAATTDADATTRTAGSTGMSTAPVVVVPCSSKAAYLDRYAEPDKGWADRDEARWPVPYWHIDTGMASLLILQTAVDEGLGACFFGIPPDHLAAVRGEFGIPDAFDPIGAITIGPPAPAPSARRARRPRRARKPVDERRPSRPLGTRSADHASSAAAMTTGRSGKLQALVRIPTVSYRDPEQVDTAAFDAFVEELRAAVPAAARAPRADPDPHATACCSTGAGQAPTSRSC